MKPREFWIDVSDEHDGDIPIAFREHPRQGPLQWQANLIHVIEYSAYQALQKKNRVLKTMIKLIEKGYYKDQAEILSNDLKNMEARHKKLLNAVIKISQCKKIIEGDTVDLAQKAIVEDEKASEE